MLKTLPQKFNIITLWCLLLAMSAASRQMGACHNAYYVTFLHIPSKDGRTKREAPFLPTAVQIDTNEGAQSVSVNLNGTR